MIVVTNVFFGILQKLDSIEMSTMTLVSNGCLDYKGRVADKRKTGGWRASPFIIGIK